MSNNEKISLLVPEQVPEFIRSDNPKFVSFLQAYYRFLEEQQGTQQNDLVAKAKEMRYLSDVDSSLDLFEEQFFNTFLSLLPKEVQVSKEFLIKNALPVYLAKGSEESFKLLFRMLFDDEITIRYPKNYILRASDGKWKRDNAILIADNIQTEVTADGTSDEFYLNQILETTDFDVYLDDVLQVEDIDYTFRKEYQKVVFTTVPTTGAVVKITYLSFDASSLANRKITGVTSGAYAIIESAVRKVSTNLTYFDVFVDPESVQGTFSEGEEFLTDIFLNNKLVTVRLNALSRLREIRVVNGGSGYAVGDPAIVRGLSIVPATAIVSKVSSGFISEVSVLDGGAGFQVETPITANNLYSPITIAKVLSVDSTGVFTPNTVTFFVDIISPYASTTLNSPNYGFPNVVNANVNTTIAHALTSNTIVVGSILSTDLIGEFVPSLDPILNAQPPVVAAIGANTVFLTDLGVVGQIGITSGGSGYAVGETLNFTNLPMVYSGTGLAAKVSHVSNTGAITNVLVTNGGSGYVPGQFPTVSSINTVSGTSAVLYVESLLGDGESLNPVVPGGFVAGEIQSIKVLQGGRGYTTAPEIDLTGSGDGLATATAEIFTTYNVLPGRWTSAEGLLSTEEIRIEGADYYVNYSYVISCKTEFSKYKQIFKELVHPGGMKALSEYNIEQDILEVKSEILPVVTPANNQFNATFISYTDSQYPFWTLDRYNWPNYLVPQANVTAPAGEFIGSYTDNLNTIIMPGYADVYDPNTGVYITITEQLDELVAAGQRGTIQIFKQAVDEANVVYVPADDTPNAVFTYTSVTKQYYPGPDPFANSTVSVLLFENNQGFFGNYDVKKQTNWLRGGSTAITTTDPIYGRSSAYMNFSNGYWIDTANTARYENFNGDYTLEFTIEFESFAVPLGFVQEDYILEVAYGHRIGFSQASLADGGAMRMYGRDANASSNRIFSGPLSLNTPYHCALVRSGTTVTFWVNGVSAGSITVTPGGPFEVPYRQELNLQGNFTTRKARIDNLRTTKAARYTAPFDASDAGRFFHGPSSNAYYLFTGTAEGREAGANVNIERDANGSLIFGYYLVFDSSQQTVESTLSGTVSINTNSNIVTGTGTNFLTANTNGILRVNSNISIGTETRTVNAIVSANTLTVSQNFTQNLTNQMITIS